MPGEERREVFGSYGFKLLVYQVPRSGRWSIRSFHARGWRIINLRRRSTWNQAISNLLAKQAQRWTRLPGDPELPPPTEIPPAALLSQLEYLAQQTAHEDHDLRDVPHLRLGYEQDLQGATYWPACLAKACDYLGLPSAPLPREPGIIRMYDDPPEVLIPNHQELVDAVARSPYSHLLEHV